MKAGQKIAFLLRTCELWNESLLSVTLRTTALQIFSFKAHFSQGCCYGQGESR